MSKLKFIAIALAVIVILIVLFLGKSLFTGNVISPPSVPSCDNTLWKHVYNSTRLKIIDDCMSVTGTIISSFQVNDGDQHIQLFPDKQYLSLLNDNNIKLQLGTLVIEPICSHDPSIVNNSTLLDAGIDYADGEPENDSIDSCRGFVSNVYIPEVGEHVRITGAYVLDTYHDWMEIHPVTKIEVIK